MSSANLPQHDPVAISDDDVMAAMKSMQGYIDITPADFKEVYRVAYILARERMLKSLKARDIMSAPAYVVHRGTDLMATAALLAEKGISGAPVTGPDGGIIGVISERDFLRKMGADQEGSFMQVIAHCLKNKGCLAAPMVKCTAGDMMSAPPITATADISVSRISMLMTEKRINRVPIVDATGKPIGIVTRSNLVNAFCMLG